MIAIDSSAILALLLGEPDGEAFKRFIPVRRCAVGAPTLVESRLALDRHMPSRAAASLRRFLDDAGLVIVPFDAGMFEAAIDAFARYGKDRGHPAKLNFGDCLSYAVARTHVVPLLFKGNDFVHTDLVPAYNPAR